MKFLLLLSLAFTLGMSIDKKIILGSYERDVYAAEALNKINAIIEKDEVLKNLININFLSVRTQTIEKYQVVSISYLKDDVQLFRTINALSKYYDDLYAIPYQEAPSATELVSETLVIEEIAQIEPEVKDEVAAAPKEEEQQVQPEAIDEVAPAPSVQKYAFQEEREQMVDEPSIFEETWILYLIVIALVLIVFFITMGKNKKLKPLRLLEDDEFL